MSRLSRLALALLLVAAALMLVGGALAFALPERDGQFGGVVRVPAALVPQAGDPPLYVPEGRFFLVHLAPGEGLPTGWYGSGLGTTGEGGVIALAERDQANPCRVLRRLDWRADLPLGGETAGLFTDPCQHATYSKAGIRFYGPGDDLNTMRLTVAADGSIEVNTRAITGGDRNNPTRALPWPPAR